MSKKHRQGGKIALLDTTLLQEIFVFLETSDILTNIIMVTSKWVQPSIGSVLHVDIIKESSKVDLSIYPNLYSVQFDGVIGVHASEYLDMIKKLREVFFRDSVPKDGIISNGTVSEIQFDFCPRLPTLKIECPDLRVISFSSCRFDRLAFKNFSCPDVEEITFRNCHNLNDAMLYSILAKFHNYVGKVVMDFDSDTQKLPTESSVRKIVLDDCPQLVYPNIQNSSVETIQILNCSNVLRPVLTGKNVKYIQLGWCEKLKDLLLGADNLEKIDLTGSGVTYSENKEIVLAETQMKIILALKKHFMNQIKVIM